MSECFVDDVVWSGCARFVCRVENLFDFLNGGVLCEWVILVSGCG